jgi:hypothetical protein
MTRRLLLAYNDRTGRRIAEALAVATYEDYNDCNRPIPEPVDKPKRIANDCRLEPYRCAGVSHNSEIEQLLSKRLSAQPLREGVIQERDPHGCEKRCRPGLSWCGQFGDRHATNKCRDDNSGRDYQLVT